MRDLRMSIIRCYRSEPNDADVKDVPLLGETIDEAKKVTQDRLLAFYNDERRRTQQRPLLADIVADDGRVVSHFQVRPGKLGAPEAVEALPRR